MKTRFLLIILSFLSLQSVAPATHDATTWYRELVAHQRRTHAAGEAIVAGVLAGICGSWAAGFDLKSPNLEGKGIMEVGSMAMNKDVPTKKVEWWHNTHPVMRGVLVGGLVYGMTRLVYRAIRLRVARFMPQFANERQFIDFMQQWPDNKQKVMAELHPLFDHLHEQVTTRGALSWPNRTRLRDGLALLAGVIKENKKPHKMIGVDQLLDLGHPQHRLLSVQVARVMGLLTDMVVPLSCAAWGGHAWRKGNSVIPPLACLALYNLFRFLNGIFCRGKIRGIMREQLHALIMQCGQQPDHFSPALRTALLPWYEQYQRTGKMPKLSRKHSEQLMAVVVAAGATHTHGEALVHEVLGMPRMGIIRLLKKLFTPAALIVPMAPALGITAWTGGGTMTSISSYLAGLAMMVGINGIKLLRRKRQHRRERVEHLVAHWPTYADRLPLRLQEVGSALHDEFVSGSQRKLERGEIDLIYERLG